MASFSSFLVSFLIFSTRPYTKKKEKETILFRYCTVIHALLPLNSAHSNIDIISKRPTTIITMEGLDADEHVAPYSAKIVCLLLR